MHATAQTGPFLQNEPSEAGLAKIRVDELIVKSGALQQAILNSANSRSSSMS